jgi:hypothetical protein
MSFIPLRPLPLPQKFTDRWPYLYEGFTKLVQLNRCTAQAYTHTAAGPTTTAAAAAAAAVHSDIRLLLLLLFLLLVVQMQIHQHMGIQVCCCFRLWFHVWELE